MSIVPSAGSAVDGPSGGNISDVVGLILDKGVVIDVYVRVSLIGIEILTIDARVVVASVDTYLRFAEAAERLNLEATRKPGLPELITGVTGAVTSVAGAATGGAAASPAPLDAAPDAAGLPAAPEVGAREREHRTQPERVRTFAHGRKEKGR
jgi:hypothetical protein